MATSAELLKELVNGAEIMNNNTPVDYSPRYKGDREPWVAQEGRHYYRYTAARCTAVYPVLEEVAEEVSADADAECTCPPSFAANDFHREGCASAPSSECTCPADERAKSGTDNHYIECPEARVIEVAKAIQDIEGISFDRQVLSDAQKALDLICQGAFMGSVEPRFRSEDEDDNTLEIFEVDGIDWSPLVVSVTDENDVPVSVLLLPSEEDRLYEYLAGRRNSRTL